MKTLRDPPTSHRARTALLSTLPLLVALGLPSDAQANHLDGCNGIWLEVEAAASCEVVPVEECEVKCTEVSMELVCASRLTTECEGGCVAEASVECRSGCEETCVPSCVEQEAADQPPNCMGLCMSDCQMDCNVTCEGGVCRSQCAQICSSDCHDKCNAEPEPVCEPVCETACWGSCEGSASVDCQISCQSELFTQCEADTSQECVEDCDTSGFAIFCDGQFLASADDLESCAAEIEDSFEIHLEFQAEVEAEASADGWFGCAINPSSRPTLPLGLIAFMGGFAWLRHKQRKLAAA